MLRRVLTLAIVVAVSIGLWAPAQDDVVTVNFWHAMSGGLGETVDILVADFNAKNPDIEVVATFQGRYGDLFTKNLAAVAAGEPPTITQMFENWTPAYLQPALDENALAPLGPLMDPAIFDDMPQILVTANTYSIDGEPTITTIPFNKSATALFYNLETVPEPPTTWDELLQVVTDLQADTDGDGEIDHWGYLMRPGSSGISEIYLTFLKMAGGTIVSDDCRAAGFESAEALTALEFLKSLAEVSLITGDFEDGPFSEGIIDMYYSTSASVGFTTRSVGDKFPWTTYGSLSGPGGTSSVIQGTNLGVFDMGNSDEQVAAAVRFVEYLVDGPQTIYWAQETGYLPVRNSAIDSLQFQSFLDDNAPFRAFVESFENAFITPGLDAWNDVRLTIADAVELVLVGGADPGETLTQLNIDVNAALADVPAGSVCSG
jgi:multiple sugar transport system substrate-binding protein